MANVFRRPWLPDFCSIPRIAALIGIAEMVVLVNVLSPSRGGHWSFDEFVSASALAIWLSLATAVVYCKSRPLLIRLPMPLGLTLALAFPSLIAAYISWALLEIDLGSGHLIELRDGNAGGFIGRVAGLSVLIAALSLRYFYVREQWQAQVNANAKAEVDALQARIRPHFLFNSMNTIAALVRRDPVTAERAVEDLSELFRAALGAGQGEATLREEIYLAERYLAIEKLRLGERLQVEWQIAEDAPKELRMPRLVLQPLLENAVLHGVSLLPEGGLISIAISTQARELTIRIGNPAPPPRPIESHHGHALESIAQRLAFHFGPQARINSQLDAGYYTTVITLPLP